MNKFLKYLVLIVWVGIGIFEILSYLFISEGTVYWRAWEAVSNYTGLDASTAPFKPRFVYNGYMVGDLLNAIKFEPNVSERRRQLFVVDEYGYRNEPGFLKNDIDAIVIGSSFVGGGQETQENLVSSMLTNNFNIRTYNSTTSVQYFWEDARFSKNKPEYLIFLGSEGEVINSTWKYMIKDEKTTTTPVAWSSYDEWKKANEQFPKDYEKIADRLKNYSMTRYFANNIYVGALNRIFNREQIADLTTQDFVTYHHDSGVMFWQEDYDIPLINSEGKTTIDMENAIKELKNTQEKLKSRGIKFIVAGMPSKTHLELEKYRKLSDIKRAIYVMNKKMEAEGIDYIDLLTPSLMHMEKQKGHLYYPDDSHWNTSANIMIADLINKKIKGLN